MSNKNPFCIQITKQIEDMAKQIQGETPKSVANLITTYYTENNIDVNNIDGYPSVEELTKFRDNIRNKESKTSDKENKIPQKPSIKEQKQQVHKDFTQRERTDRVSFLADLFSDSLDELINDESKEYSRQIEQAVKNGDSKLERDLIIERNRANRKTILEKYGPKHIFDKVKEKLELYLQLSPEGATQLIYNELLNKGIEGTQEQLIGIAKKFAANRTIAFQKMLNNFEALAFESTRILRTTEEIIMSPNMNSMHQQNSIHLDVEGNPIHENPDNAFEIEETVKEGWMDDFRTTSNKESLSKEIREYINSVEKTDFEGNLELDDIGMVRKLDASYVNAILLDALEGMRSATEMIDRLYNLAETKPWVDKFINDLELKEYSEIPEGASQEEIQEIQEYNKEVDKENDSKNVLISKMFVNYNKHLNKYWIQKTKSNPDGSVVNNTIPINRSNSSYFLLTGWRDNIDSGVLLNKESIYDNSGNVLPEVAGKHRKTIQELQQYLNKSNGEQILESFDITSDSGLFNQLVTLLESAAINIDNAEVLDALIQSLEPKDAKDFVRDVVDNLGTIFRGVQRGEVKNTTEKDGTIIKGDLVDTFGTVYSELANSLKYLNDNAFEASFREAGKGYYSYTTPNQVHKIINALSNFDGNLENFVQFIEDNYGMYDWFRDENGNWLNNFIEELVTNEESRKMLDHKVLLHRDRMEYSDQMGPDYLRAILVEYDSDPNAVKNPNKAYSYYHIPVFADASSSEFIKFRRYTRNGKYTVDGKTVDFKGKLLHEMSKTVQQEFNRMQEVAEVFIQRLEGEYSGENQKNFDISFPINRLSESESQKLIDYYRSNNIVDGIKKIQEVIKEKSGNRYGKFIGGLEFKFHTALNNDVKVGKENVNILDILKQAEGNEIASKIKENINQVLNKIMDQGFDKELKIFNRMGILDETSTGVNQLFPKFKGNSQSNNKLIKALETIKKEFSKTNSWLDNYETLLEKIKKGIPIVKSTREGLLHSLKKDLSYKMLHDQSMDKLHSKVINDLEYNSEIENFLEEYYWNSKFATSQIIQIFATDLAYFNGMDDFQKRFKMYYSPSQKLNTESKYGRTTERNIYINDFVTAAPTLQQIDQIFSEAVKEGRITERQRVTSLSLYSEIEATDGQAFRCPSSMRAVLDMAGDWNDDMERAFNNFKEGTWDGRDFDVIFQPIKQFTATSIPKDSGVFGRVRKVPTQHKNSELMLTAAFMMAGALGKSEKIRAIMDYMEESFIEGNPDAGIDVIQFSSAVKVGKQGAVNISGLETYDEVKNALNEATYNEEGEYNDNSIHEVSYDDYGIQVATPDHHIDTKQLIGTQLRKLIPSDMSPDAIIQLPNSKKTMSFKEWYREYNRAIISNVINAYAQVEDIFNDPRKVEEVLQNEIMSNNRYGLDLLEACSLQRVQNADGTVEERFTVPLVDALQVNRTMALVNSIIKSKITKQKIAGGSLIQATNFGYEDSLSVRYKDANGNLIDTKKEFGQKHNLEGEELDQRYTKYLADNPSKSIDHLEAYLPWYSKKYLEHLIKEDGSLDVDKVPEELRRIIGYRVPTEDAYSMFHIRIKGFTPPQMGGIIMLPSEIITMSGSDFDIDKLYIFVPEFDMITHDKKRALRDFKKSNEGNTDLINSLLGMDETTIDENEVFNEFFEENKDKYELEKPILKKKQYREELGLKNSTGAVNNRLIDLMWAKMSHPDTAHRTLKPGGFDNIKHASGILNPLGMLNKEQIKKIFPKANTVEQIVESIMKASNDQISLLQQMTSEMIDPLSPSTQLYYQEQNMTGKKLVSIYAVNNSHHALMQHTNIEIFIKDPKQIYMLNGTHNTSLHSIKNAIGQYISNNNASYLAAAVDNAKDPQLSYLHLNINTAPVGALLSRSGYTSLDIGALLNQPGIKNAYFIMNRQKTNIENAIDETIKSYENALVKESGNNVYSEFETKLSRDGFLTEDLLKNIFLGNNIEYMSTEEKKSFYMSQIEVLKNYRNMIPVANALTQLTQVHKADTNSGGAGPKITDTMSTILKIEDIYRKSILGKFPIANVMEIIDLNIDENLQGEQLMNEFLKSPVPFLQAFFTLGVQRTDKLLRNYYPFYNDTFKGMVENVAKDTKREQLSSDQMMRVFNDMIAYKAAQLDFFKGDRKRQYFINNFPNYFKKLLKENTEFAENDFIKRLSFVKAGNLSPLPSIQFKTVGALDQNAKDKISMAWESMFYSSDPIVRSAAQDIFLYGYYRNGFDFGPSSYMHLASANIKQLIPQYTDMLRNLDNYDADFRDFKDQYLRNNTGNKVLFPLLEIKQGSIEYLNKSQDEVRIKITDYNKGHFYNILKGSLSGEIIEDIIVPRFTIQEGNTEVAYEMVTHNIDTDNKIVTASFKRVQPLGFKNQFKEFSDSTSPISVLAINNKNFNKELNNRYFFSEENINSAQEQFQSEMEVQEVNEITIEEYAEAIRNAHEIITGEDINLENKEVVESNESILDNIQPREAIDDEGNKICIENPKLF